jgi:3-oxoadipate enol-lactonase
LAAAPVVAAALVGRCGPDGDNLDVARRETLGVTADHGTAEDAREREFTPAMTSIRDQLREQMVDTVLGRIRVQVGGSGSPIVFWPSLLMTGDMWHGVADNLIARRRVILVDPPGQGGSQSLTDYFSFDDCARCVADILDGLGLDKAHFVGNSWGGMIGATFAATYPERIGAAVLMNCTAGRASLRQKLEFAVLLRVAKWTGVNIASASWAVKSVVPRRPDQRALLGRIQTPVMVVGGAEDATFPPRDAIDMAKAIPNASIRVLDGVAHLAGLENPPLVSALVEQFLFGNSESGSAAT